MKEVSMRNPADLFQYNLQRLREERGYDSGKDLAKAMGVAESSVSKYANGSHFPRPDNMQLFADFFRVPVSELFKTPAELEDEKRVLYGNHSLSRTLADTNDPLVVAAAIEEYIINGGIRTFFIRVSNEALAPYAHSGDQLECRIPGADIDGQMVIVKDKYRLVMGRAYRQANGYMLIPGQDGSLPISITANDENTIVLAVVLSRKHHY